MIQTVLNNAKSYVGIKQGDSRHKELIDKYNAVKPVPSGHLMKYTDNWCATFITYIADMSNVSQCIGRECGVQRFIHIFKTKGIWLGITTPNPGDIIVFDWQKNGWADHIGFVEEVKGNQVTTIEGNTSKSVARRTYAYNDWRVAGYARPNYPTQSEKSTKTDAEVALEVMIGKWGNGTERIIRLKKAGYHHQSVQNEVMRLINLNQPHLKSNEVIAKEVLQGKWSNGQVRKKNLVDAGYDPIAIQKIVNKLI